MYEILEHADQIKAVKENHAAMIANVASLAVLRVCISFAVVITGIAVSIAVVRF